MDAILFWAFALGAVVSAGLLIFHKNPIHSALSLIGVLFCTAALFVLLHAGLLAVLQVLVYAGAIMVLFVFVIMLLNLQREELGLRRHGVKKAVAVVAAVLLFAKFATVAMGAPLPKAEVPPAFGSLERVGELLLTSYVLPFETVALLLLAAMVGAVVVAKTKF
ncbi:MAG: NADH-quinone oxidoreductase subunit J [Myxococcales bacterium]|nr:MAG: NADH-quinone oxidoreductase subunit J [Myxococcales bacterium]